jgi:hypothetical protein
LTFCAVTFSRADFIGNQSSSGHFEAQFETLKGTAYRQSSENARDVYPLSHLVEQIQGFASRPQRNIRWIFYTGGNGLLETTLYFCCARNEKSPVTQITDHSVQIS